MQNTKVEKFQKSQTSPNDSKKFLVLPAQEIQNNPENILKIIKIPES